MSSYWTDYLDNGKYVKNVATFFLFHKIENNHVIDYCDVFEASTFTINWCRSCPKELGGTGVKCADRRVVFEHMRGYL